MRRHPRPFRLVFAVAFAAICVSSTSAQVSTAPRSYDTASGIRLDHSRVLGLPVASNTEREGAEFNRLDPSSFTMEERRMVLMAPPPSTPSLETIAFEDRPTNPNFDSGRAILKPIARAGLDSLASRLRGKSRLRFEIVGHTDNEHIAERLKPIYPTNQALSEGRAVAVAEYLRGALGISPEAFSVRGMADTQPVASNDTPEGMAANRRTMIRVWYEQTTPGAPGAPQPVEQLVLNDACAPAARPTDLPFSISVDGQPLNGDTSQTEADRQRCVDVALDRADIQIKYDPLNVAPALNVWAAPSVIGRGAPLIFRTYSNYAWFLKTAEIRIFTRGQGTTEQPLAIIPVAVGGEARWTPPAAASSDLGYVLRVYDAKGRFDETSVRPLQLIDRADPAAEAKRAADDALIGYGESTLKIQNTSVSGGAVTISGERVKPGQTVTAMGVPVPVDANGKFVMRQILPPGGHSVNVAVSNGDGRTATFTRNLAIPDKDWFYVAVADLTAGDGRTTGPAQLVTADNDHYDRKTTFDGRLAFYLKGKILGKYLMTASADTREQPVKDLFSNFASKDPNYLLRRLDPNRYYPVYGDDSVVTDDAPTQGKFYVRIERDQNHVMWGNFQTQWTATELTQYSRGLYGADVAWKSKAQTSFGERRATLNVFAAEPGTLQSREEFRGTGGSLYYLRRQDLTEGSDRIWIEIRDKDSGLVIQRTLLSPAQDYEIDYLQGRVTLRAPLPFTADGSTLVKTSGLSNNPVFLVATYEYVPGLTKVKGTTLGARGSVWLTDFLQAGATYYKQGDGGVDQELTGADMTLRFKPGTWLRGEIARSNGVGVEGLSSISGGYDFTRNTLPDRSADAYRLDAAINFADLGVGMRGRMSAYMQQRDSGFSGPGLITANGEGMRQQGVAAVLPIGDRAEISLKVDDRNQFSQSASSEEVALRYKMSPQWGVSVGVRNDDRQTGAAGAALTNNSPYLSRNGERADAVVRLDYRPLVPGQDVAAAQAKAANPTDPVARASDRFLTSPNSTSAMTADTQGPAGSLLPAAISPNGGVVAPVTDPEAAAGVAAARVAGLEYQDWNLYGFVQQTLSRNGNRQSNDRGGVGGSWQASDRLRLGAEASGGDGGAAGKLSADYALNDRSNVYFSYARETEAPDENYAGEQGVLTAGGRMRLNDQLGLFAETRQASGEGPSSLTHGFGVDYAPAKNWTTGVRLDTGRISDPIAGDLKRFAVGVSVGYRGENLKAAAKVEYRMDEGDSLGTVTGVCSSTTLATADPCVSRGGSNDRETVLFKSDVSYQATPSLRLLGAFNASRSSSDEGAFYDGDYTEAVLGAAYRPVDNDRFNALFKYTYFYNLPSAGQVDNANNNLLDYTQRSHVVNIDAVYDLTPWLSVGGKYGLRVGELRDSRTTGAWYSSNAQLVVLRGDLHFVKEWDAVVELRRLSVSKADDVRSGILIAVYRHIGEHGKIGFGYNFTDFSDDLTDLSYRSRGFFINALASF